MLAILGRLGVRSGSDEDRIETVLMAGGGKDCRFAIAEVCEGRLAEETEDDGVASGRQIVFEGGVADDGRCGFEAALPAGLVASRTSRHSGANPAATSMVCAIRWKSDQREAMPTRSAECSGI